MNETQLPDDEKQSASGTLKASHLILIATLAIVVGALLIYYLQFGRRADDAPVTRDKVAVVPEGSRAVTLYFADRQDQTLITETRLVAISNEYTDQIAQVVRALLSGPEQAGVSTVADGTRLLDVFYDSDRSVLYLDFTSELVAGHPGGSSAEYYTIAAVMRTVSENFPEVRAVQFLIEGFQVGTIAGHIDAYDPFLVSDWR